MMTGMEALSDINYSPGISRESTIQQDHTNNNSRNIPQKYIHVDEPFYYVIVAGRTYKKT